MVRRRIPPSTFTNRNTPAPIQPRRGGIGNNSGTGSCEKIDFDDSADYSSETLCV